LSIETLNPVHNLELDATRIATRVSILLTHHTLLEPAKLPLSGEPENSSGVLDLIAELSMTNPRGALQLSPATTTFLWLDMRQ
jgi:hypothetical protein